MTKPLMTLGIGGCLALAIVVGCGQPMPRPSETADEIPAFGDGIPAFEYDPTWPKPLPNNWMTGSIGAMAMDSQNHIWVAQRPGSTTNLSERYGLEGLGECCFPAPPVMEFDPEGNLIQAWGPIHDDEGQLLGDQVWGPHPDVAWPVSEHGLFVDDQDTVWVGSQNDPSQLMRFTRDGTFLMHIGQQEATSSNDPVNLAGPTGIVVDAETNEVFVAGRLQKSARGRVRRRHGRVQTPLGRVRQAAARRTAGRHPGRRSLRSGRRLGAVCDGALPDDEPETACCMYATAETTGFRCSRRTARSSRKR